MLRLLPSLLVLLPLTALGAPQGIESSQDVTALITDGDAAYEAGKMAEAAEAYVQALRADPNSYEAAVKASDTYREWGQLSLERDPANPKVNVKEDRFIQAEAYGRHAIKLQPEDADGYFQTAASIGRRAQMMPKGKTRVSLANEIRELAEQAVEINPDHDGALHVLGTWNREITNLSGLERFFFKLLGGNPEGASYVQAEQYLRRALELAPNSVSHHLDLGKVYMDMERWDDARKEFHRALELPPSTPVDPLYQAEAGSLLGELADKN